MDSDGQYWTVMDSMSHWLALLVLAAPGHPPPDMIGFNTSNPHATNQITPDGVLGWPDNDLLAWPACLHACLHACRPACLLACPPAFPPCLLCLLPILLLSLEP